MDETYRALVDAYWTLLEGHYGEGEAFLMLATRADDMAHRAGVGVAEPGESFRLMDSAYSLLDDDPFAVAGVLERDGVRVADVLVFRGKAERHPVHSLLA